MAGNENLGKVKEALDAIQTKIEKYTEDLKRLQKAEDEWTKKSSALPGGAPSNKAIADGNPTHQHAPTKTVFKLLALKKSEALKKGETFIDPTHASDEKRLKRVGEQGKVPGDEPQKKVSAPGSGGEMSSVKKADAAPGMTAPNKPPTAKSPGGGELKSPAGTPKAPAAGMSKTAETGGMDVIRTKPTGSTPGGLMQMSEKTKAPGVFGKLKKKVK